MDGWWGAEWGLQSSLFWGGDICAETDRGPRELQGTVTWTRAKALSGAGSGGTGERVTGSM